MMNKILYVILISLLTPINLYALDLPDKFVGKWEVKVDKSQKGFPWWDQIKHPVLLVINKSNNGYFIDQQDANCPVKTFNYDADMDSIAFIHCGSTKYKGVIPPYQIATEKDGLLHGEVRTYNFKFRWTGKRVDQ